VSPSTVRLWEKAGKIASIRTLGNHRRYRKADVEALAQSPDGKEQQGRKRV
jgi:excisionase family DNA binding protein